MKPLRFKIGSSPLPRMPQGTKVVFLDRDGTINESSDGWWKKENWTFTHRAPEALRLLRDAGFVLAVVTNQAGVSRKMYSAKDVESLHQHMTSLLESEGISIAVVAYCTHGKDAGCTCRKPRTGMAEQVEAAIGAVDYSASWMVGDKISDLKFGQALGTHTALIRSGYWKSQNPAPPPELVVSSLYEAAVAIHEANIPDGGE